MRDDPVERASFDPFFTFFLGGVAVFEGDERVGAVGVSGLPGEVDEELALRAIAASAASSSYRTIRGSVKTSDSSRLCVENSETIAPSSPAWNQWSVSGGIVNCSPGCRTNRVLAGHMQMHRAAAAAERLLLAGAACDRRVPVLGAGLAR